MSSVFVCVGLGWAVGMAICVIVVYRTTTGARIMIQAICGTVGGGKRCTLSFL